MKKYLILGLVVLSTLMLTGCGKSSSDIAAQKTNGVISFATNKDIEKYELKTAQEGVTYREIKFVSHGIYMTLVPIYNDTDNFYEINVKSKKDSENIKIAPHFSGLAILTSRSSDYESVENVEVTDLKNKDIVLSTDLTFKDYKFSDKKDELSIYFTYNGAVRDNRYLKTFVLCLKDGKIIDYYDNYIDKSDELGEWTDASVDKKGDIAIAWEYGRDFSKYDSYVYFIDSTH